MMKSLLKIILALSFWGLFTHAMAVVEQDSICAPANYNPTCNGNSPVCGQPDDSGSGLPDPVTYSDRCEMEDAGARILHHGTCNQPPSADDLELKDGHRFLTSAEVQQFKDAINEGALNSTVTNHSMRDFYDRYPEYWSEVIQELKATAFDFYAEGILSQGQYYYLTQFSSDAADKLSDWKEACSSCRYTHVNMTNTMTQNDGPNTCGVGVNQTPCPEMCPNFCPNESYNCRSSACGGAWCPGNNNATTGSTHCSARFDKLSGLLSDEVLDEIPKQRRTQYIQFLRDTFLEFIQVKNPGQHGEICSNVTCAHGLTCAPAPENDTMEPKVCSEHYECPSRVCNERPSADGRRYCSPVMKCYSPITDSGASCVDNPVCGAGLTCHAHDTGLPTCSAEHQQCSEDLDCCSGSCSDGTCDVVRSCLNCAMMGEEASPGKPCCPGAVEDPHEGVSVCVQMVPDDISYEAMIGLDTHFLTQEDPFDLEKCEFDWYQSYLSQLKDDPKNFEREMSLLSFEFVAGGEDFVDDYWDVNSRLKTVVERRQSLRHWLFAILQAEREQHELVLEQISTQMDDNDVVEQHVKNEMLAQYREVAALKEEYYHRCVEINETIETGGERGIDGADSDGERANILAMIATDIERKLIVIHDVTNTSPSFQELVQVRQDMVTMEHGWKRVDEWKHRYDTWSKTSFFALLLLVIGLAIGFLTGGLAFALMGAAAGFMLGNMLDGPPGGMDGATEINGIYEAMWGTEDDTWPKAEAQHTHTTGSLIKTHHFRIDVHWPKSYCPFPDRYDEYVLAVSGSCLKRFAYTVFEDEVTSLVDPFVPANMTQRDLFRCANRDQRDFVPLVNTAANKSINYLLKRRKSGLNSRAIELAFPDISQGNKHIMEPRKDIIRQKAIEFLNQEFPDLMVTDEFVQRWAQNTYKLHFAFPKLSNHGDDIGYPKRGIVPYLTTIAVLLGESIEHNYDLYDEYTRRIGIHQDLINHMVGSDGVYYDDNVQVFDLGDAPEPIQPSVPYHDINLDVATGLSSSGDTSGMGSGIVGNQGIQAGEGDLQAGLSGAGSSALNEQFQRNRARNGEIRDQMRARSEGLRENLRKQGGNPDMYDDYYSRLYASVGSPSTPFNRANLRPTSAEGLSPDQSLASSGEEDGEQGADADGDGSTADGMAGAGAGMDGLNSRRGETFGDRFSSRDGRRGGGRSYSPGSGYGDGADGASGSGMSEEMLLAQREIENSLNSVNRNPDHYLNSDKDSLFDIITKSYFRNYDRLLERRSRERDRTMEFE